MLSSDDLVSKTNDDLQNMGDTMKSIRRETVTLQGSVANLTKANVKYDSCMSTVQNYVVENAKAITSLESSRDANQETSAAQPPSSRGDDRSSQAAPPMTDGLSQYLRFADPTPNQSPTPTPAASVASLPEKLEKQPEARKLNQQDSRTFSSLFTTEQRPHTPNGEPFRTKYFHQN